MLNLVKNVLRISTDVYDLQIGMLIESAKTDLGIAGVTLPETLDDICKQAICTYCRMNFGTPSNYDQLKRSYDEQKAQLSMATGYTDWGGSNG